MRRHLNMSLAKARSLPWWEHDLLVEGLVEEFGSRDQEETEGLSGLDELAELGVSVREADR